MKLIEYDKQVNQAILNGIRTLSKESAKRVRKYSAAIWIDIDAAMNMTKGQFEGFFMGHAEKMMEEAWRTIREIKKEEKK